MYTHSLSTSLISVVVVGCYSVVLLLIRRQGLNVVHSDKSLFGHGKLCILVRFGSCCRMVIRLIVSCTFFLCLLCVLYMDVYQIVCGAAEEGQIDMCHGQLLIDRGESEIEFHNNNNNNIIITFVLKLLCSSTGLPSKRVKVITVLRTQFENIY